LTLGGAASGLLRRWRRGGITTWPKAVFAVVTTVALGVMIIANVVAAIFADEAIRYSYDYWRDVILANWGVFISAIVIGLCLAPQAYGRLRHLLATKYGRTKLLSRSPRSVGQLLDGAG
jgi:hypothetical protein